MKGSKRQPGTVDDYLARVQPDQRAALETLRQAIHAAAPNVEECISYGIPAFRLNGRALLFFGAWANHCALYPGSAAMLKKFRNELVRFQISKGTIRFTVDKPVSLALVKKLVKARIAQQRLSNPNRRKS
jgi:uncharacterized protein YdhG (YjbR/CyaY superfamily)